MSELDGPRQARPDELDAILTAVNHVMRAPQGLGPTIAADYPQIYSAGTAKNIIIVRTDDRVVSSVGLEINDVHLGRAMLRLGSINCLMTMPDHRRRGLAGRVMKAAHERMAATGCSLGRLRTGIPGWYRRLGWEHAGGIRVWQFTRTNIALLPALPVGFTARKANEEDYAEVVRLHNGRALGAVRELAIFKDLLIARGRPTVLMACRGTKAEAYIMTRDTAIIEWLGPSELVSGLAKISFEQTHDPDTTTSGRDESYHPLFRDNMTLVSPTKGHALIDMLEWIRIPYNLEYAGMLYLADPARILGAFGLDDIEIQAQGQDFCLTRRNERALLSRGMMTKLFFGPERVSDFAADVFRVRLSAAGTPGALADQPSVGTNLSLLVGMHLGSSTGVDLQVGAAVIPVPTVVAGGGEEPQFEAELGFGPTARLDGFVGAARVALNVAWYLDAFSVGAGVWGDVVPLERGGLLPTLGVRVDYLNAPGHVDARDQYVAVVGELGGRWSR